MQVANDQTVLGDFNDTTFTHNGLVSRFFRKGAQFFVNTDGPDGKLRDYQISYTIGVYPLQQYLIEFPGGRYQALSICWDSRPAEEGGLRWYHLYPDETIDHNDELHWTGPNQNWNYMCAECHTTNLRKNYDLKTNTYSTTWSEINVSCETCHGPGSKHVTWAKATKSHQAEDAEDESHYGDDQIPTDEITVGLSFRLKEQVAGEWTLDSKTKKYGRSQPLQSHIQLETCARCHARRHLVHQDYIHGKKLMDSHQPVLLREDLYHADGQILEEVYVYGSFIQSRMYHKGVRCTDCHDPHRLNVIMPGNTLCTRCHLSDQFDTPKHHFHETDSAGASCVACHMPMRKFMVVDPRFDHSFRVPRPDLSVQLGTPNACNDCHKEQDAKWAAGAVAKWYGPDQRKESHFGEVLHAGRNNLPGAAASLSALAIDQDTPAIVRGTAISLLARYPSEESLEAIRRAASDHDPLVRRSSFLGLEVFEPHLRVPIAVDRLQDPVRAVRIEAARSLASLSPGVLSDAQNRAVQTGLGEFIVAQLANAERPERHMNLGNLYAERGQWDDAETAYRTAIRIDQGAVQSYVNLADLYRIRNREQDCERFLRQAIDIAPELAASHHALGLALVRQKRTVEAIESLHLAADLDPDDVRFSYVYAVALMTASHDNEAMDVLRTAHQKHPGNRDLLIAMMTFSRDRGKIDQAIDYAEKLLALDPQDMSTRRLIDELKHQSSTRNGA